MGCYVVWKFAKNKPAAEKFLADLIINYKQATIASKLYNFPSFPGAFPFNADLSRREGGHAQAAREVHDPDDDRGEVHAQRRLPGHVERGDQRDLHDVPDPADVRAGRAGQDERRRTP